MPRLVPALPAAALIVALHAGPAVAAPCPGGDVMPTRANLPTARHAVLCLLNHERRSHGLHGLAPNADLQTAAQRYAQTMVRQRFFDHVSPGGSTLVGRARKAGYGARGSGWILGENLAWGSGSLGTPREAVRGWMRSAGHRHNILTARFTDAGIGIAPGAPVRWASGMAATYALDLGATSR
jgi:uncharacterized protein YkwD